MGKEEKEPASKTQTGNEDAIAKPDPGTTDTTDPQKHMKGPLSSLMQSADDVAKDNEEKDAEDKE